MAVSGPVREATSSLLEAAPHRAPRERAGALLAGIESLQEASDPRDLTERAALAVLSLTGAALVVVCFDGAGAEPQIAFLGTADGAGAENCAAMLRALIASGAASPFLLLAHGTTMVAPFGGDSVRGGILVENESGTFNEADGRVLAQFAWHSGAAVQSLYLRERARRIERVRAAALDALPDPLLIAVDGRVELLNPAAAQILCADRDRVLGSAVGITWPELAPLLAAGKSFENHTVRLAGKDLVVTLKRISEGAQEKAEVLSFRQKHPAGAPPRPHSPPGMFGLDDLVGESAALCRARELALIAARSSSGLLIEGESGVGKEVLAQAIHTGGPRSKGAFIAVHCAAIPRDLLESELFGYDKGAFTGADPHGHAGKFELANGGTLLLDDVVELPLEMQAKLLRVLQERSVTRLGGSRSRPVDVRIVATSNVPLRSAMDAGRFRADLFFRLNVLHIAVPPLRDRKDDLRPLSERFLRKYSPLHGRQLRTVGADALRVLESYSWPGNVRELEHWMESEVHFASPSAISLDRLTRFCMPVAQRASVASVRPVREVERELYAAAIAASAGDITRAARDLGVSRGTLYRKLRLYGLEPR
jgi:transcriptional regulator with PAS, ATPase and Fis domain